MSATDFYEVTETYTYDDQVSAYRDDPHLPPGCSDNDPYFDMPNASETLITPLNAITTHEGNTKELEMIEQVDTETGEIVPTQALMRPASWSGAASRGLEARREREAIVKEILREGHDFGTVPGCGDKPALLKPGAEKIADALNLYPDYEELDKIQDFLNRVWFYRYRCRLRQRGSDMVMSTGIGSCNSEAAKYKYREAQRECPGCGAAAIIKGKEEYGGGWLCYQRKGGCGMKFRDDDARIIDQKLGQVENPDIASLVNTVDKMAQKSSFVAACLNLGFSEQFTQDIDDTPAAFDDDKPKQESAKQPSPDCPECGGPMWNNRESKRNPRAPDFKCKDKSCNGAIWPEQEEKKTSDQALRDDLFNAAEKLLAGMDADKRKKALGRLLMLDTETMAGKVNELAEKMRAKTTKSKSAEKSEETEIKAKAELQRQARLEAIRKDFDGKAIAEYLAKKGWGANLERLSLDQLVEMHEEMIPF